MRFARHAKIFRGPLDPAPVAGVLLLLLMFMLLSSLVYTPGVLVKLGQTLTVTSTNSVLLAGKTYLPGELDQLRTDLKSAPGGAPFSVVVQPGADPDLGRQVSNLFQMLGQTLTVTSTNLTITSTNSVLFAGKTYQPGELAQLRTDLKSAPGDAPFSVAVEPGANPDLARQVSNLFQITLPEGRNLTGTDNATVMVAVNFRGQCFYENRLVQEAELKTELARRLKLAARDSRKLTLILQLDKAVEYQVVTRLEELARQAGIPEVIMAERPALFGPQP